MIKQRLPEHFLQDGVKFGGQIVLSFVVNIGLTALGHEVFRLPEEAAYLIALIFVFLMNFFLLRYFLFGKTAGSLKAQLVVFTLSTIAFRSLEYGAFLLLHTRAGFHYLVVTVGVSVVFTLIKYSFYRYRVFRPVA